MIFLTLLFLKKPLFITYLEPPHNTPQSIKHLKVGSNNLLSKPSAELNTK